MAGKVKLLSADPVLSIWVGLFLRSSASSYKTPGALDTLFLNSSGMSGLKQFPAVLLAAIPC